MRRKFFIWILSALLIMIGLVSCNKTNEFEAAEQQEILDYLDRNSTLNFELKPSGLYYLELVKGTGRNLVKFDTVFVRYTGKFLDGRVFDTNVGTTSPMEVIVGTPGIIMGFNEGLTYMAQGGKSWFLIPSSLGYGSMGNYYGGIGGYTPLLFEVQVVDVKLGPGK
ncbi:MAG TPA: FKBP-type peptidyl-prolyl cis-trans isomerase [Bacteroidales bacterium]|nr:FKBP-type peptidyl-prolyl cis-trans isomerase [Bacteroidales bacterium]